jgi:cytochrome subunit of sulfide dehydrogenase
MKIRVAVLGAVFFIGTAGFLSAASLYPSTINKDDARVLASNCMQCHGTNGQPRSGGNSSLVGTTYSKLRQQMLDLKNKDPATDSQKEIMIMHAKVYYALSPDQIDAIAAYLSGN